MNNKRATKRALLTSVMALVMCVVMLVGTTFAWFTDTASTGVNKIQAGNLDIEVEYRTTAGGDWKTLDNATDLFGAAGTLFEPGHTRVVELRITNAGNLALKYKIGMNVVSETEGTNKDGNSYKLSNYLKVATSPIQQYDPNAVPGSINYAMEQQIFAKPSFLAWEYRDFASFELDKNERNHALDVQPGDAQVLGIKVYMPESVGNEANAKTSDDAASISFGLNILATQYTTESDSYGTQYDKDATYPTVTTAATIENAFSGESVDFGYGNTSTAPVTLDGKGVTVVSEWTDAWVNSDTTIKGVTFANGAVFSTKADNVTVTLENCTFYACDQSKLTYTGNNSLTNSGAGMCLNLEKSSHSGVKFIVKNCTFVGENDNTLSAEGPRYNGDGTVNGMKKRGHAIALDAICGGGTGTLDSLLIDGCVINGVRGNAIQLYGNTGDITIKDTKINSWAVNSTGVGYAIRGDFNDGGTRTLTLNNVYFGLNEIPGNTEFGHVKVGSFSGNTDGTRMAGTY